MTAILLIGFGLTIGGIGAILAAVYFAWRQLARELDDVRKREKARERVYQLMTKGDPDPELVGEPPSTKRRGHLRVIKVAVPIALMLAWLREQRQAAALAAGGLAIAAVAASGPLPPLQQQPPVSTPSPQSEVVSPPPTMSVPTTPVPPTMPSSLVPRETVVQPPVPPTTSAPRESSTVILSSTLVPSLPHSKLPPSPPDNNNDCTIQVLELCVPPIT